MEISFEMSVTKTSLIIMIIRFMRFSSGINNSLLFIIYITCSADVNVTHNHAPLLLFRRYNPSRQRSLCASFSVLSFTLQNELCYIKNKSHCTVANATVACVAACCFNNSCWYSVSARKDWWTVSWPCGKFTRTYIVCVYYIEHGVFIIVVVYVCVYALLYFFIAWIY